jgi:hypothetical protein
VLIQTPKIEVEVLLPSPDQGKALVRSALDDALYYITKRRSALTRFAIGTQLEPVFDPDGPRGSGWSTTRRDCSSRSSYPIVLLAIDRKIVLRLLDV